MSVRQGLEFEWKHGLKAIENEGLKGAKRFSEGAGRHGDFKKI